MHLSRSLTLGLSAALVLASAGCSESVDDPTVTAPTTSGTPAADATTPAGSAAALRIEGFGYDPVSLTVAPGAMVEVTNADSAEHTVTSEAKGKFDAAEIKQNEPVTFKAPSEPGTYKYICTYHSTMHGTLVVKE